MYSPDSVLENETHKIFWARKPDREIVKKRKTRTCRIVDFAAHDAHRRKIEENEKRDKYSDLT